MSENQTGMAATQKAGSAGGKHANRWMILAVLCLGLFMSLLDVSIVNVALSSIQKGLGATQSDLQWVVAGYALTFGVIQVPAGRAGDLFGREGLYIVGILIFTLASVWAGAAGVPLALNLARAVQGFGAGLVTPQVIGMIQQYFSGAERGQAFGIFGGVVGVAVAIGPTLGGTLIHLFGPDSGWRAIFYVNLPVGAITILLAALWFPKPLFHKPTAGSNQKGRLDPVGTVLLGVAVLAVLAPFMVTDTSALIWLSLPAGLVLLAVWLVWEGHYRRRGNSPMVDVRIFKVSSFRNGTALIGLYFFGAGSIWVILNLFFQQGLGHSALASGLLGLPSAVMTGLSALITGRLVSRYGRPVVIWGIIGVLAGLASAIVVVYLNQTFGISEWWLIPALMVLGAGGGAVVSPNQTLTLENVPLQYAGSSGGVMQTAQQVGISVGIAVVTAATFTVLANFGWVGAFFASFSLIMILTGVALAVAIVDQRARKRTGSHPVLAKLPAN